MAIRPAIFKWRQTEPVLILCAVRWYLRYSLSLRYVEELLDERGLQADHTTVWRWVQRYAPELEQRLRRVNLVAARSPHAQGARLSQLCYALVFQEGASGHENKQSSQATSED
jgi:hypothetical protein